MYCGKSYCLRIQIISGRKYHTTFHFFYANKSIAIIWPATVPRGGIKSGVLLGFWYGNKLKDVDNYLIHGTNKQVFYKIFEVAEDIDDKPILKLLKEAVNLDKTFIERSRRKRPG